MDDMPHPYLKFSPKAQQFSFLKTRAEFFSSSNCRYIFNLEESVEEKADEGVKYRDIVTSNAFRVLLGTLRDDLEPMITRKDLFNFNPDGEDDFITRFEITGNELVPFRFKEGSILFLLKVFIMIRTSKLFPLLRSLPTLVRKRYMYRSRQVGEGRHFFLMYQRRKTR